MIWGCGGTNFIPSRHEVQNYNLISSGNPHMEFWGEGEVIAAQGEWMESKATDGVLHHRMYKDVLAKQIAWSPLHGTIAWSRRRNVSAVHK